jgi:hypothetical protein
MLIGKAFASYPKYAFIKRLNIFLNYIVFQNNLN